MNFSDDEMGQEESAAIAEILEYARKAQALDMRRRYNKPLPGDGDFENSEEFLRQGDGAEGAEGAPLEGEEAIPGVEPEAGAPSASSEGEGDDNSTRHEMLRAVLAKMQAGEG